MMATRKGVSDPDQRALGKFQGTIDRISNFRDQAFNHNLGRNVRVLKVLLYLLKMVQDGCRLQGAVDCVAAERQNFSSSKTRTQAGLPAPESQAAHFLPGQLQIGGQNVWQFASDYSTRTGLEFLFAEVEHLPTAFNQADSVAENKGEKCGLAAAFASACAALIKQAEFQSVGQRLTIASPASNLPHAYSPAGRYFDWSAYSTPHPHSPAGKLVDWASANVPHPNAPLTQFRRSIEPVTLGNVHMGHVHAAFEIWNRGAIPALQEAAKGKRNKPALPPLEGNRFDGYTAESIEARSTAGDSAWNQDDAVRILEYYLQDQQERTEDWARTATGRLLSEL
jgi:hypothetical protein